MISLQGTVRMIDGKMFKTMEIDGVKHHVHFRSETFFQRFSEILRLKTDVIFTTPSADKDTFLIHYFDNGVRTLLTDGDGIIFVLRGNKDDGYRITSVSSEFATL
jgi:hypothetical protein